MKICLNLSKLGQNTVGPFSGHRVHNNTLKFTLTTSLTLQRLLPVFISSRSFSIHYEV